MKKIVLIIFTFLITTLLVWGQDNNIRIEIQIIGYDGFSPFEYSISDGNYYRNYNSVQPDISGRIVIQRKINSTKFFQFYFQNKNEKRTGYSCRLVLQPGNNYSVICKKQKTDDYNIPYSPDIFSWKMQKGDRQTFYKMDMGQVYYNLFDNATQGYIYREEWNLLQPDSLLITLSRKTNKQVEMYSDLLKKGEIDNEFFEIAKLNVKYFNAYRLASTIESSWFFPRKFGIKDSISNSQLIKVYQKLFKLYPLEGEKLEYLFLAERYIDVYLNYLESFKDGDFSIPQKGSALTKRIEEIKSFISKEVYKNYKMRNTLSRVGTLELESSKSAKEFLESNSDLKQTVYGDLLENVLVPRSEAFDSLSQRELPKSVVFLDEEEPIQLYSQLVVKLKNKPALIDFWGTWCGPCKYQFQYTDSLKVFLNENGIEMIYAAYEYKSDREKWKKIIAAYDLKGKHLMIGEIFKNDLKNYDAEITGFPTIMLINDKGEIVESQAYLPSDGEKLISQIKEKLINNLH